MVEDFGDLLASDGNLWIMRHPLSPRVLGQYEEPDLRHAVQELASVVFYHWLEPAGAAPAQG